MSSSPVYFFGTCLIDAFYPETGLDAIALLEICGREVLYLPSQTCCGQPPYNSGYPKQSTHIAKQNIQLFSEHDYPLIVPSASCAGMFQNHYPKLLEEESSWKERAAELASRTYELFDFLADELPFEQLPAAPKTTVALHTCCSAKRETGSAPNWEKLLQRMPNVELRLPRYQEECCGFGGTFSIKSPEISSVMTEDKCRHLIDTGAETVVSGDCGCLMNLQTYADKQELAMSSQHLASFVIQQLKKRIKP